MKKTICCLFAVSFIICIYGPAANAVEYGCVGVIGIQCTRHGDAQFCDLCKQGDPRYKVDDICVSVDTRVCHLWIDGTERIQIWRGDGTVIGLNTVVYSRQGLGDFVWDQTDTAGRQVEPGTYTVAATAKATMDGRSAEHQELRVHHEGFILRLIGTF